MAYNVSHQLNVTMYRDGLTTPWGFRLFGGVDFDSPFIVQRVTPASAASSALQSGDIILKINDFDATTLKHAQVLDLISAAGGSLRLTIVRHQEAQQASQSTLEASGRMPNNDRESKIPKLADIMKESLKLKEQGQLHTIRTQGFRGTPISRTSPQPSILSPKPNPSDLISYLPRLPPKKVQFKNQEHQTDETNRNYFVAQDTRYAQKGQTSGSDSFAGPSVRSVNSQLPQTHVSYTDVPSNHAFGTDVPAGRNRRESDPMRPLIYRNNISTPNSSGRSSPNSSSVLEIGDPNAPKSVGVWIPPTHHPNAKLVHVQYNTPLGLYSAHNVADSVEKMTGTKIEWMNRGPPNDNYLNDIRESATYKYVQEMDGRSAPHKKSDVVQSRTIKNLNRFFRLDDGANS